MLNNHYDSTHRSVSYLYKGFKRYIEKTFPNEQTYCPEGELEKVEASSDSVVNVLLLGSSFRSLLEMPFWQIERMRLWVVSNVMKEAITRLFKIDPAQINIVPLDTYQNSVTERNSFEINDGLKFVYGGRLNDAKNINHLVYTIYYLQKKTGKKVELDLIGDFDNQEKIYVEYKRHDNQKEILNLIDSLDWLVKPNVKKFKDQSHWLDDYSKEDVFISLSTNIFEDFGVSTRQALEKGMALVLSDWGGHQSISSNCLFIPYEYLVQFKESSLKGEILSQYIIDNSNNLEKRPALEVENNYDTCNRSQLVEIIRENTKKYSSIINLISRGEWNEIFFKQEGIEFISKYRSLFYKIDKFNIVVVDDYYNFKGEKEEKLKRFLLNESDDGFIFLSYLEVMSSVNRTLCLKAQKIFIACDGADVLTEKLQSFLSDDVIKVELNG